MVELYKRLVPILEFSLRLYIAYYLFDYGIAKLTGGMFNNASPAILKTELQYVDLFHLTWFYFYKSWLLTYFIGCCQMLAAIFLLFNRTVLLGCAIALPVLINIFIIDLSVFRDHTLAIRVLLYTLAVIVFMLYRKESVTLILKSMFANATPLKISKPLYVLYIPVALGLFLLLEILICKIATAIF